MAAADSAGRKLSILVLGGGLFVGRALVEAALAEGHDVTVFNRGKTSTAPWAKRAPKAGAATGDDAETRTVAGGAVVKTDAGVVRMVHGDRGVQADLERLAAGAPEGGWDAVVDTCCYLPGHAALSAAKETLGNSAVTRRYVLVSTISVYSKVALQKPGVKEDAPLAALAEGKPRDSYDGETYGALKAECEECIRDGLSGSGVDLVVVRPGLIVGPWDTTDRFTYWPARIARGGTVLAPSPPEQPLQFIDVRDLAAFLLKGCHGELGGSDVTFNATGPLRGEKEASDAPCVPRCTLGELIDVCVAAAESECEITWAPQNFLTSNGVDPWVGLPLWIAPTKDDEEANCILEVDVSAAQAAGLRCRPVEETVRDILTWLTEERGGAEAGIKDDGSWKMATGISSTTETEVLAKYTESDAPLVE